MSHLPRAGPSPLAPHRMLDVPTSDGPQVGVDILPFEAAFPKDGAGLGRVLA